MQNTEPLRTRSGRLHVQRDICMCAHEYLHKYNIHSCTITFFTTSAEDNDMYMNIKSYFTTLHVYRTKRYTCSFTTLYGGSGGGYFDDGCPHGIRRIDIHYQGHTIRAIRLRYINQQGSEYDSASHGHQVGTHYQVNLSSGEEIVAMVGRYTSSRIQQLAFLTQHPTNRYIRHTFGPYGNAQGSLFIENRGNIVAVYGRKGYDLDAVGFKYRN